MQRSPKYTGSHGFVLTAQGRLDLAYAEECRCVPRVVGGLVECAECGTVYGLLRERDEPVSRSEGKRR